MSAKSLLTAALQKFDTSVDAAYTTLISDVQAIQASATPLPSAVVSKLQYWFGRYRSRESAMRTRIKTALQRKLG